MSAVLWPPIQPANFHLTSKDTGYDPLIEHLRSRNIHAQRHNDFTTLPLERFHFLCSTARPGCGLKHRLGAFEGLGGETPPPLAGVDACATSFLESL
jgi:hypothetical protein